MRGSFQIEDRIIFDDRLSRLQLLKVQQAF